MISLTWAAVIPTPSCGVTRNPSGTTSPSSRVAPPAVTGWWLWLQRRRRLQNGLYAWAHAYESGVENAPRFGDREERRLRDTRRIAAPDLSAYAIIQCEALATMARLLGKRDDASAYLSEAAAIRNAAPTRVVAEFRRFLCTGLPPLVGFRGASFRCDTNSASLHQISPTLG